MDDGIVPRRQIGGKGESDIYNIHDVQKILHLMGCKTLQVTDIALALLSGSDTIEKGILLERLPFLLSHTYSLHNNNGSYASSNLDSTRSQYQTIQTDLKVACSVHEKIQPIIILLGGTSGCGKSTIASLLSSKFGIASILSTDTVRHVLRTKHDVSCMPYLWTSSYQVSDVTSRRNENSDQNSQKMTNEKKNVIRGYQLQSATVLEEVEKVVHLYASVKRESLIIEGVHLSMEQCANWMNKYQCVVPFMLYIGKETKHMERFAIRAKYMTLEPHLNKYMRYFDNIRIIQDHLSTQADIFGVPKIDNTNVDRTIAILHQTIFAVLRSQQHLCSTTAGVLIREFDKIYARCMRSKEALSMIRQREARKRSASETRSPIMTVNNAMLCQFSPPMRSNNVEDNYHTILLMRCKKREMLSSMEKDGSETSHLLPRFEDVKGSDVYLRRHPSCDVVGCDVLRGNIIGIDDDEVASLGS